MRTRSMVSANGKMEKEEMREGGACILRPAKKARQLESKFIHNSIIYVANLPW
jgi:hypothetical protein